MFLGDRLLQGHIGSRAGIYPIYWSVSLYNSTGAEPWFNYLFGALTGEAARPVFGGLGGTLLCLGAVEAEGWEVSIGEWTAPGFLGFASLLALLVAGVSDSF